MLQRVSRLAGRARELIDLGPLASGIQPGRLARRSPWLTAALGLAMLIPGSLFLGINALGINAIADTDAEPVVLTAVEVTVGGTKLGLAASPVYFSRLLARNTDPSNWLAAEAEDLVQFAPIELDRNIFALHTALALDLARYTEHNRLGWSIVVDGFLLATLPSEADCREVIARLQIQFLPNPKEAQSGEQFEGIDVNLPQRPEITPSPVARKSILSTSQALKYLLKGTTEERTYTVVAGDSVWNIARRHGLWVEDIIAANPRLDPERIFIGDVLNLIVPKPLIIVETRYRRVYSKPIAYQIVFRRDNRLLRTESVVQQRGRYGEERITEQIVSINGLVQSRDALERTIISHPVTKIVRKGTRRTPEDELASAILPPGKGILTSPFGKRWGGFHKGIDYGVPMGTPVHACEAGEVIFAGFRNVLGKLVVIQHKNSLVTYYGHNSRLQVKEGDRVAEKQVIAYSGNTGHSTGPHLHFEVHHIGRLVDPLTYLKKKRDEGSGSHSDRDKK